MNRTTLRRVAAAGASAAMIATGMTVSLGAGTAAAQESACQPTKNFNSDGIVVEQTADKAEVAPGGTVTYQTKVSRGSGIWMLKEIGQFHDPALTLDSSKLNVWYLAGGQKWGATHLNNDPAKNLYWESGSGWDMTGGNYAVLEMTYRVSDDAQAGSELVSGVQAKPLGWSTSQEWPTTGACVKVRAKNPVESANGSLDSAGLGSVSTASTSMFGSLTNPTGSVSDVINGIDFGKIFGAVAGS
ncbi:hypothetical protein [Rhodococcus sp. AG1013]|uniref:hypothetical protein n=1 Tax=unclassified Rhodococcus (in: high G+C Gram-positive bacteria) TaxID=192944 RepID=UPI000E0A4FA6|nr:hypothetical protein [Rhodococcus sp. AG1013]RDI26857.1 hypothetical protein DEU38_10892 [Rhodococcus sp. AG1013]